MDKIVNKDDLMRKGRIPFFQTEQRTRCETCSNGAIYDKTARRQQWKGIWLPFWIKNNFRFNIARSEYPRAFRTCESKEKYLRNRRRVILPFKGGNFTSSRLSLTLKDEELCLFSFLIIDGPFAYCLSFTAWLGGWETGWDFGFACIRSTRQIEQKKNELVNTHPSKQYLDLSGNHLVLKGFLESKN